MSRLHIGCAFKIPAEYQTEVMKIYWEYDDPPISILGIHYNPVFNGYMYMVNNHHKPELIHYDRFCEDPNTEKEQLEFILRMHEDIKPFLEHEIPMECVWVVIEHG